jgi:hypothetical protein
MVDCNNKGKCEVLKNYPINPYGGTRGKLHAFLTLALDGGEWSASCLTALLLVPMEEDAEWCPDLVWA